VDSIRKTVDDQLARMYKKTTNYYTIYVNYPENKTTVFDMLQAKYCEYVEDFSIPTWTILDETQEILSHKCKKATCRFRGRDYIAWYALDIPISRGPYKFAGLPGLIMKIFDTENLYSFECIEMEKTNNNPMYKDIKENGKILHISKKEFINMEKKHYGNPKAIIIERLHDMRAINVNDIMNKLNIPEGTKIPYNPIELE
jgi:GLPGLI family protein